MHVLLGMVAGFLRENQVEAISPLWLNLRSHSASFPSQLQMSTQVQGEETPSLPVWITVCNHDAFFPVSVGRVHFLSECVCEDVSRWDSHLNQWTQKSRLLSSVWVGSCKLQSTGGLNRTKRGGREDPSSSILPVELGHQSLLALGLELTPSAPLVPRPSGLDWILPLTFLGLQLADGRSWDFSASKIMWASFS